MRFGLNRSGIDSIHSPKASAKNGSAKIWRPRLIKIGYVKNAIAPCAAEKKTQNQNTILRRIGIQKAVIIIIKGK